MKAILSKYRRIRICELIYRNNDLREILDLEKGFNGRTRTGRCKTIQELKISQKNIDAIIISGDPIHIFWTEDMSEDWITVARQTAYIHESESETVTAVCKAKFITEVLEALSGIGHYPTNICLAPFHFTNNSEKYLNITTSTWKLEFSAKKLVSITHNSHVQNNDIDFNYAESFIKAIEKGAGEQLSESIPAIVANRNKAKKQKSLIIHISAILLLFMLSDLTITLMETYRNQHLDDITKTRQQANMLRENIEHYEKEEHRLDSILHSKSQINRHMAAKLDMVASVKPDVVMLTHVTCVAGDDPDETDLVIEGISMIPEAVSEWISVIKRKISSTSPRILTMKYTGENFSFSISI